MDFASKAHNIDYYHVLQPNQYLEGSKPIGKEEAAIAVNAKHPYRRPVQLGYPLLSELGQSLSEKGVMFTDMTMIFQNNETPLYVDECCHLNKEGYRMIAEEILEVISANSLNR